MLRACRRVSLCLGTAVGCRMWLWPPDYPRDLTEFGCPHDHLQAHSCVARTHRTLDSYFSHSYSLCERTQVKISPGDRCTDRVWEMLGPGSKGPLLGVRRQHEPPAAACAAQVERCQCNNPLGPSIWTCHLDSVTCVWSTARMADRVFHCSGVRDTT